MKKFYLIFLVLFLIGIHHSIGQVGVGTLTPDSSSILDISSSNKGVLFPRIALRGANIDSPLSKPVKGLIVWNTGTVWGTAGFYYNNSDTTIPSWTRVASGSVMQNVLGLGKIWIGDSMNIPMERTVSGDITINVNGLSTISNNAVNSIKIADSSVNTIDLAENAVTGTKIDISGNAAGSMMYYNGTNWVNLSKDSSGEVLTLNLSGNPSWSRVEDVMNVQNGIQKVTIAPNASVTRPYLELGGTLIRNTTITQGNFNYLHDLTGTGNFRINHNNTNLFNSSSYPFGINRLGSTDFVIGSDASYAYLQSWNSKTLQINNQGNNTFINPNSGNIAIGHIAPSNKVDITNAIRSGTHPNNRPLYVTGNFGANNTGVEFRHINGTQGIGFGYNTIYATGSDVNQSLGLQSLGTGDLLFTTNGSLRMLISGATGNVGIGQAFPNAPLHFANLIQNRKIMLWESSVGSDHLFYGFGINGGILRYQVDGTSSNHVFYAGTSFSSSNELMRIQGNGNVAIGTSAANANAILDLTATNKGFLPPRLTTAQRDAISGTIPEGLMIYNIDNNCPEWFDTRADPPGGPVGGYWNSSCNTCENVYAYNINSNGNNFSAQAGSPTLPQKWCVWVNAGVTLGANTQGGIALNFSGLPAGSEVTVYNYGTIMGGGGAGGGGGQESDGTCAVDNAATAGGAGGAAIVTSVSVKLKIINYGTIAGGGGGGGGGSGGCRSAGGGGGGGRGIPGGNGGYGWSTSSGWKACGVFCTSCCGSPGSTGGFSGNSFFAGNGSCSLGNSGGGCFNNGSNGGCGGNGGGLGTAGSNGTGGSCGSASAANGGAAGAALVGNGSGSYINNQGGTYYGAANP